MTDIPIWKLFIITYKMQLLIIAAILLATIALQIYRTLILRSNLSSIIKKKQNSVDGLTGLLNAKTFRNMVRNHFVTVSDMSTDALLIFDVDDMNSINEQQGTYEGDKLLQQFAGFLKSQFRDSDLIGRLTSDTFAVYMKNIHTEEFLHKKINQLFERKDFLRVSAGITIVNPRDSFVNNFAKAAQALELAKANGKNQFYIRENSSSYKSKGRNTSILS